MSNDANFPVEWSIVKIIFSDGRIIYNYSDENGVVALPGDDEDYKIDLEIFIDEDDPMYQEFVDSQNDTDSSWSNYWTKVLFYGGLIAFGLLLIFGESIIAYYKEKNDPIRKAIEKAGRDHATYTNIIADKLDSIRTANPYVYVYTNDKDSLSFVIQPNLESYEDMYSKHNLSMPGYIIQQDKNAILKRFIVHEKEDGYNIWLKTTRKHLLTGHYTNDTVSKYKTSMTYFYTDKEKETVKRIREKRQRNNQYFKTKLFQEAHVDSLQTSFAILSAEELEKGDYNDNIKAVFAPRINPKNKTQKIYFTFYSKNGTESALENKIQAFTQMYFNGKKCNDCSIRKVRQQFE
ncbi:MAG: hypothetical protein CSA40_01320 [Flavobacteriales bacterium]|nr:MAG: hypothetical protein CSA40_01320 [Flavobacteriales bacterium]